ELDLDRCAAVTNARGRANPSPAQAGGRRRPCAARPPCRADLRSAAARHYARAGCGVLRRGHGGRWRVDRLNPPLPLERVGQLDEELPIESFEDALVGELTIIAIADEHDRLPIELIGKQRRTVERPRPRIDR